MPAPARFLDESAVAALLPTPAEVIALFERTLRAPSHEGALWSNSYQGAGAGTGAGPLAGRKRLSALAGSPGGAPRVVLESAAFTDARAAASAALAAKLLADPRSEVVTVLGCNARGRAVIAAMMAAFPKMERMLCYDPDVAAQATFADEIMIEHNLASIIPPEPHEATEGAHILVSCLPVTQPAQPTIEADWLQTGTLVIPLDLDATVTAGAIARAERRLTDDLSGFRDCARAGHLAGWPEPEHELSAVLAGTAPGRGPGAPIIAVTLVGHPALDAALAGELLRRAESAGRGVLLA